MASEDFLIHLSVVFKKFGLIGNEFLSVIWQFLNVGIMNLSLEFYISLFPQTISLFAEIRSKNMFLHC